MIALLYVGGLYLTNISEEAYAIKDELKEFVTIRDTYSDTDAEQIQAFAKQIQESDIVEIYPVYLNYYRFKTMLGFTNGDAAYVFTKEDFQRFNTKMHLITEDVELAENTILLSEKEAAYLDVKDGGLLESDRSEDLSTRIGKYPFQVVTFPREAFSAYFISEDAATAGNYLITWKEESKRSEFLQLVEELKLRYDKLDFTTYQDGIDELHANFSVNNLVYYSMMVIVAIVFAITTNAVFVGIYDKRKHEFALYQGIGIPKKKIYRKVATEILCMNGMGLLLGAGFSFLVIRLLNDLEFSQNGLSMWYYHPMAMMATVCCDLAILIPGIGLRIRKISKDIKDVDFL
jgi:ABC-type antimicrobial peptide transport system permease subunit